MQAQGMDGGQEGRAGRAQRAASSGGGVQLGLDGVPPVPSVRPATDRLFFALYPDAPAAARIAALAAQLARQHGLVGTPLPVERLHVTLHHLGDFDGLPRRMVEAARVAAQQAVAAPAAGGIGLVFDHAASFAGRRDKSPFVLRGGDALWAVRQFQQQLTTALNREALAADAPMQAAHRRFEPHATLLYDAVRVAEHPVEPVAWTARELVLVRSLLGRSTHIALARWPLP